MTDFKRGVDADPQQMELELRNLKRLDHEQDRVLVIDGWVFARTEALAASALVLFTERDCRI
jgi:hypothetical protein